MNLPKKEKRKHLDAFEIFYKLGPDRTHAKVAKEYGVSKSWVEHVSRHFNWMERVRQRDQKVSDRVLENIDDALVKAKKDNLQIIKAVKMMLADKIKRCVEENRTMEITLTDFERLAKLELLMLGDPTERISDDTITGLIQRAAQLKSNRNTSQPD